MIWFWPVIYRQKSLRGVLLEDNSPCLSSTVCHEYVASRSTDCLLFHTIFPRMFKWHITLEDTLPLQSKGEVCLEAWKTEILFHCRAKGKPTY